MALPSEVQHRYFAFSAGASYIGKQNLGPYKNLSTANGTPTVTTLKFFGDGHDVHSIILRDGRRVIALLQIDTKQLSLNPPKLFGLQPHEKRMWWQIGGYSCKRRQKSNSSTFFGFLQGS
jgi:hypothetical protein